MASGNFVISTTMSGSVTQTNGFWSTTQDAANNRSFLTAQYFVTKAAGFSSTFGTGTFGIVVDGITYQERKSITIPAGPSTTLVFTTPTITINHNSDGSRSVGISVFGSIPGTTWTSTSGSTTAVLDKYNVTPPPTWSTTSPLPTATVGTAYSTTVTASPVTSYSLVSSSGQTDGLTVSGNTISGTPTTAGVATFIIRANNSGLTADRTFNIPINPTSDVDRVVRMGMWTSTGTNFTSSTNFTLPTTGDNLKRANITPRTVFSGTQYWVGFSIISPRFFSPADSGVGWGLTSAASGSRGDATPFTTSSNFTNQNSAGQGGLAYRLYYDVLPTQPLNLVATVSGEEDLNVTLTWDEVASDGGQPVTSYRIQQSQDNVTWTTIATSTGSDFRGFNTSQLIPGVRYYFRVAAINAVAIAHGTDYSGPYSVSAEVVIPEAVPGNAQSFLTATVANPNPAPVAFSDFGPGIRFTKIDVQYGSEFLYTEIEASTQDAFGEIQVVDAPLSKALYGVRSYSLTNLLNSTDQGAFEVAKDYLTYYYEPELRVQSITVDLSNLTIEQKLEVLGLEIDSFITVSFTPNGVGDPKVASGLVTGISHRITLTSHEVELRLRNERNLFTLNSDSKGILNVNTLGP
jgi:hypothetical protein